MNAGYKDLAAAVVRQTVDDLQGAYNKVKKWDELESEGKLRDYVKSKVEKGKIDDVSLAQDELSAVSFFKPESDGQQLYFSMLDIDGVPEFIVKQRDYLVQSGTKLEVKIQYYRRHIAREKKDAAK